MHTWVGRKPRARAACDLRCCDALQMCAARYMRLPLLTLHAALACRAVAWLLLACVLGPLCIWTPCLSWPAACKAALSRDSLDCCGLGGSLGEGQLCSLHGSQSLDRLLCCCRDLLAFSLAVPCFMLLQLSRSAIHLPPGATCRAGLLQ